MAAFVIPCQSDLPHFTFQCELDGITFEFEFRWNERSSDWFMILRDVDGNVLLGEQRVASNWALASRKRYDPAMPSGSLMCFDTSGQNLDPGLEDLGQRVQILYYSSVVDGE